MSSLAPIGASNESALSWLTRLSRTRVSTVDGFSFSQTYEHDAVYNLEGILRTVQRLKVQRYLFEDFRLTTRVGQGETFDVEKCEYKGQLVAVKHIRMETLRNAGQSRALQRRLHSVLREISIMQHTPLSTHPNILGLLGYGWRVRDSAPLPYIVVEYGAGGSLRSWVKERGCLNPDLRGGKLALAALRSRLIIGGDVASGLMALHQSDIVHGDMKLDNIIMFDSWDRPSGAVAKISDFGHSIFLSSEDTRQNTYYGTGLYNAPEVSRQKRSPIEPKLLHKCDIWAYGLLIWELLLNGEIYFQKSWRDNPDYARIASSSLNSSGVSREEEGTSSGDPSNLEEGELGHFDLKYLKTLAKCCVNSLHLGGADFEKGYLRSLFEVTLQEQPALRLSNLSNLPIIGVWNHTGDISLRSRLAMHFGTSELSFDMFRLDQDRAVPWEHQVQMLQDFERISKWKEGGSQSSSAAFQSALCYILGFGAAKDHIKALQYLRQAVDMEHVLGCLLQAPMLSALSVTEEPITTIYTHIIRRCLQQQCHVRTTNVALVPKILAESSCTNSVNQAPKQFVTVAECLAYISRMLHTQKLIEPSTLCVTLGSKKTEISLLELAIAEDDYENAMLLISRLAPKDIDLPFADGQTPLIKACKKGSIRMVRTLLDNKANPYQLAADGSTIFHWLFCIGEDLDQVERLLFTGDNITNFLDNVRSKRWLLHAQWPLQLCGTPLACSVMAGSEQATSILLRHGASPVAQAFETDVQPVWTPLHLAVRYHFHTILEKLMLSRLSKHVPPETQPQNHVHISGGIFRKSLPLELQFPGLELPCVLSHSTMAERYGIHGHLYHESLVKTINLFPNSALSLESNDGRTALFQAIDFEDLEVLGILLARRPDLASKALRDPGKPGTYTYPLHYAAQIGAQRDSSDCFAIVEQIIAVCPTAIMAKDSEMRTALHMSATGVTSRITTWLVAKGIPVDAVDRNGRSALFSARSMANFTALLAHGALANIADRDGLTILHLAAIADDLAILSELVTRGVNLDTLAPQYGTALHCAVFNRFKAAVIVLINAGASVDVKDGAGNTPLMLAVRSRRSDIVELLLDKSANIFAANEGGEMPLSVALEPGSSPVASALIVHFRNYASQEQICSFPHICAETGNVDALRTLLSKSPTALARTIIDIRNISKRTPLHTAAQALQFETAEFLLQNKAYVDAEDASGATPLLLASAVPLKTGLNSATTQVELCDLLRRHGASIRKSKNHESSPWLWAFKNRNLPLMSYLLDVPGAGVSLAPPDRSLLSEALDGDEVQLVVTCIHKQLVKAEALPLTTQMSRTGFFKLYAFAMTGDAEMVYWRLTTKDSTVRNDDKLAGQEKDTPHMQRKPIPGLGWIHARPKHAKPINAMNLVPPERLNARDLPSEWRQIRKADRSKDHNPRCPWNYSTWYYSMLVTQLLEDGPYDSHMFLGSAWALGD